MTTAALSADRLYRFFRNGEDESLALRGVSLSVEPGEIVAVVGPSGCGKSTLLACLAGLDEPDGGTVRVGGERVSHRSEADRARLRSRRIGVLLQSRNLLAHLDVRSNVRLARAMSPRALPAVGLDDLLDSVGMMARAHAYPEQLSGGELARAGLAVALANAPDVLLADEPTGELDGETERQVLDLLRATAGSGCALLVVTHSRQVTGIADRVIALRDGQVAA
ncbi:ABC transporter ATP-binding protein [Lapillicoccus sp.]|uniref:ABC transporter ATP-binding protein n=1 Tax=Lapillicoccus sp. TaxID=1909287 RepID=UPI0025DBE0F0|nr:ABC transporter ATP-binding protein [Lapillicoccus sp.]